MTRWGIAGIASLLTAGAVLLLAASFAVGGAAGAPKATVECANAQNAVTVAEGRVAKAKAAVKKAKRADSASKLKRAKKKLKKAKEGLADAMAAEQAACVPIPADPSFGLYVALGDSVAAQDLGVQTYVVELYAHYQSTLGVTQLSNRARSGENSAGLRNGGQLANALADINAASDTRVVTIDIGGNDGPSCPDWNTCPFRGNFKATLADIRAALANDPGDEPLIAMAYYNPDVGEPTEANVDNRLLGINNAVGCADSGPELGLNDIIAQEAGLHQALLANPYPAFKINGQAFLAADSFHPNAAGHAAIAAAFKAAGAPC